MARPSLDGVHHLKFPVSDLERSEDFYARVLGGRRIAAADHRDTSGRLYAIIMDVPGLGTLLELRLDAALAARHAGFDPVTLQVDARADLDAWISHLDREGAPHSDVLPAMIAWIVVFEDPDGRRLRLYTREQHGPEIAPSQDRRWL